MDVPFSLKPDRYDSVLAGVLRWLGQDPYLDCRLPILPLEPLTRPRATLPQAQLPTAPQLAQDRAHAVATDEFPTTRQHSSQDPGALPVPNSPKLPTSGLPGRLAEVSGIPV
jgi:hypothetical protein